MLRCCTQFKLIYLFNFILSVPKGKQGSNIFSTRSGLRLNVVSRLKSSSLHRCAQPPPYAMLSQSGPGIFSHQASAPLPSSPGATLQSSVGPFFSAWPIQSIISTLTLLQLFSSPIISGTGLLGKYCCHLSLKLLLRHLV